MPDTRLQGYQLTPSTFLTLCLKAYWKMYPYRSPRQPIWEFEITLREKKGTSLYRKTNILNETSKIVTSHVSPKQLMENMRCYYDLMQ